MSSILEKIKAKFAPAIVEVPNPQGEDTLCIPRESLLEVVAFLQQEPELRFEMLVDLTVVDHSPRTPRFEVVYHFLSLAWSYRLRLRVPVLEENPLVPSLASLYPGANWLEREAWDMFGVGFSGHPDLRRILMYEEFEGHPLRKDYPYRKRQPLIGKDALPSG